MAGLSDLRILTDAEVTVYWCRCAQGILLNEALRFFFLILVNLHVLYLNSLQLLQAPMQLGAPRVRRENRTVQSVSLR